MVANCGSRATASAVRKQGDIGAGFEVMDLPVHGEKSELPKMISGTAGPELGPSPILVLFCHRADIPVCVHDLMVTAILESGTHTKASFGLDRARKPILVPVQFSRRDIEDGHLHP